MSNLPSPLMPGRSFLDIVGCRIETLWLPSAENSQTTWVLLHEGLGCVELWRDFPERLSASTGDSVFVYSRQGYGRSDAVELPRPLDYMTLEATETLGPVIRRLPGEHILLLGHSDGGSIAALHAGLCPDERLQGLVLVAPHFFTEPIAIDAISEAKIAYDAGELRSRLAKFHRQNVDCAFNGWCDAWLHDGFRLWDIRYCLPLVKLPMVLIQGDRDRYGTLQQVNTAAELAGGWTQLRVLPDCDHSPHREAPTEVLQACHSLKSQCVH